MDKAETSIMCRRGNIQDLPALVALCKTVGWNEDIEEVKKNHQMFPEAFFISEVNNEVVGVCFGFAWNDQQGFIDTLVVREDYRRKGIARELVKRCLSSLGTRNVSLYNEQHLIPFYESVGFKSGDNPYLIWWHTLLPNKSAFKDELKSTSSSIILKSVNETLMEQLIEYDRGIFPANRKHWLEDYAKEYYGVVVTNSSDLKICGYGFLKNKCGTFSFSPVTADSPSVARAITEHLVGKLPNNNPILLAVNKTNPHALNLVKTFALPLPEEKSFSLSVRMMYTKDMVDIPMDKIYFLMSMSKYA